MVKDRGPALEPGRGDGVTAADFAELARRRWETARADAPTLGPAEHHVSEPHQCAWHNGRVYTYATTPDGQRHYCGSCTNNLTKRFGAKP